ncbi:MAG: alpha/beta hydrolase, partial [Alphaproteobacteria bacterium]|nr:alpha/beta hydrolase [Alphaproteobacteria bacterium]
LERIGDYVGRAPDFAGPAEAEAYLRQVSAGFGALSDEDWRAMTGHSLRPTENGRLAFHYDPKIGDAFRQGLTGDVDLWPVWDAIRCPVLVLRGETSDLLTAETVEAMKGRGPACEAVTIPCCGHAPALMDETQIRLVADWLG